MNTTLPVSMEEGFHALQKLESALNLKTATFDERVVRVGEALLLIEKLRALLEQEKPMRIETLEVDLRCKPFV